MESIKERKERKKMLMNSMGRQSAEIKIPENVLIDARDLEAFLVKRIKSELLKCEAAHDINDLSSMKNHGAHLTSLHQVLNKTRQFAGILSPNPKK